MNAKDINVGGCYAASLYGKPRMGTDLVKVRIKAQNNTSGGKQTRFDCLVVGGLNRDWEQVEYDRDKQSPRTFRSGQIFMPWPKYLLATQERRDQAKEYKKRREEEENKAEREKEKRKEMVREVAALTGVWLLDLDNEDGYSVRTAVMSSNFRVNWDTVAELLESLQTQKKLIGEASRDAMDLLSDVF